MTAGGFIGIWSDIAPEVETDYLHWLTREHTTERVSIPGFLAVRVFRALHTELNRYFILYELEGPDVVSSSAYLERLNAPTAWSRRMMPNLGNFVRGGGRAAATFGAGQAGFASPIPLDGVLDPVGELLLRKIAQLDRVARVRAFQTDEMQSSIKTNEKNLRGDDRSFKSLVLIEALDERALGAALKTVSDAAVPLLSGEAACAQPYLNFFSLDRRLLHGIPS